jgi:hypothetical protein
VLGGLVGKGGELVVVVVSTTATVVVEISETFKGGKSAGCSSTIWVIWSDELEVVELTFCGSSSKPFHKITTPRTTATKISKKALGAADVLLGAIPFPPNGDWKLIVCLHYQLCIAAGQDFL